MRKKGVGRPFLKNCTVLNLDWSEKRLVYRDRDVVHSKTVLNHYVNNWQECTPTINWIKIPIYGVSRASPFVDPKHSPTIILLLARNSISSQQSK